MIPDREKVGYWIIGYTRRILLPRWRQHPYCDDILATAHRLAWMAFLAAERSGRSPLSAAANAVRFAPAQFYRKQPPETVELVDELIPKVASPENAILSRLEAFELLRPLWEGLTDYQRRVLALVYGQELSCEEAAKRLDIPVHRVRSTLSYAVRSLRRKLGLIPPRPRQGRGEYTSRGRESCRRGHLFTPENTSFSDGFRHCILCRKLARDRQEAEPSAPRPVPVTCGHGHPWTPANTVVGGDGRRRCKACRQAANRRYEARESARKQGKQGLLPPFTST